MKFKLPGLSTLRDKFLPEISNAVIKDIKIFLNDEYFVIADENTDSKDRKVLNILMGNVSYTKRNKVDQRY